MANKGDDEYFPQLIPLSCEGCALV